MSRFVLWLSPAVVLLTLYIAPPAWSVAMPQQLQQGPPWTCDFPNADIDIAPVEGALWLEAVHSGCCWDGGGSYDYPGDPWCDSVPVEVTVLDGDGAKVPGSTVHDPAEEYRYGDILWVAHYGPLSPSTAYTAQLHFDRYEDTYYDWNQNLCYLDSSCRNGEACGEKDMGESCTSDTQCLSGMCNSGVCFGEEGNEGVDCEGHVDYEISFTTHGEASPTVAAPEMTTTVLSGQWVPEFGCYVPRVEFIVQPPQVDAWYQPYLRYDVVRVIGPNELLKDRWGGARMTDGPVTSKAFDWRGWVPGVTDEYCARVEVRSMGPDTTVSTTVCLGPEVLPGLETNEGAPWTTVPEDGPFCSSDSEPVPDPVLPPENPEPEPSTSSSSSSSSSGCGSGPAAPLEDGTTALVLLGLGILLWRRTSRPAGGLPRGLL